MKFTSALLLTAAAGVMATPTPFELDERMEQGVNRVTPMFSYKACGTPSDVLHVDSLTLTPNPPQKYVPKTAYPLQKIFLEKQ
jgi:hypothetical protein